MTRAKFYLEQNEEKSQKAAETGSVSQYRTNLTLSWVLSHWWKEEHPAKHMYLLSIRSERMVKIWESKSEEHSVRWVEESPLIRADTLTWKKKGQVPFCSQMLCGPVQWQDRMRRSVSNSEATRLGNHKYCKKHCQRAFIFHMLPQLIGLSPPSLLSQFCTMTFKNR